MRWLCSVALLLALFTDPAHVQASQGAEERSIDESPMTTEVDRMGHFMAWGFDALWMMTAGTTLPRMARAVGRSIARPRRRKDQSGRRQCDPGGDGTRPGPGHRRRRGLDPEFRAGQIFKFDPLEKKVVLTIPVRFIGTEGSVGVGEGSVWITARGNVLTRFNAATGVEEATIKLPGEAPAAIVDNGFVWVTGFERGELYKVDARTNTLVQTIPLRPGPRSYRRRRRHLGSQSGR